MDETWINIYMILKDNVKQTVKTAFFNNQDTYRIIKFGIQFVIYDNVTDIQNIISRKYYNEYYSKHKYYSKHIKNNVLKVFNDKFR